MLKSEKAGSLLSESYDTFPTSARVWVYQSYRAFTEEETRQIREQATLFLSTWSAHGAGLKGRIDVIYGRFIRVAVDETTAGASGCSIDKLTAFIRRLEREYSVRMLDTMAIGYRDGDTIKTCSRDEFQRRVAAGEISEKTIVFDNSVTTKEEFDSRWEVPIGETGHRELLGG